jgi:hypothetical protein
MGRGDNQETERTGSGVHSPKDRALMAIILLS